MNSKLKELNDWLVSNCDNYSSMITVGSTATGDALIEGRSDNDICLIFEGEFKQHIPKLREYCLGLGFEDEDVISTFTKKDFVGPNGISHDFSHKFRSKVLFGEDFNDEIQLPDKETILEIYSGGLNRVKDKLWQRLHYGGLWEESRIKKEFWKIFKHAFMYLSIKNYYETGVYPKTRDGLVECLASPVLNRTLTTLKNINNKNSEDIISSANELLEYL
ncbi:MAG: hypothetical protein V3V78_05245 [Candidatus Woesearchaeota archaeon]